MGKKRDKHQNALEMDYQLHWYQIKDILGQGGFGITYLAYDMNLDHEVAIKEYLPYDMSYRDSNDYSVHSTADDNEESYRWGLDRFVVEARTIGQFKHPNIVRVRNVFEANNTAYMVMDYELGESLQDILNRRKTLPQEDIESVIFPILDGVKMVHAAGFIHRDIKPGNIYIRVDGDPVLLDFGSARQSLEVKKKSMTSMFSKGYAPIEQYHSSSDEDQDQGPWTDIYSLGATMYRCLAGLAPTDAVDRSSAIIHTGWDNYVSAYEIGAGKYSKPFLEAIDYALKFKRQNRPPTISDWQLSFARTELNTDEHPTPAPGNKDDDKQTFAQYLTEAEAGDTDAQADVAYCLAHGLGTEQDDLEAFNWYFQAAEEGHMNSQFNLAVLYAKGRGVKQNYHEALHWYECAAEQGDKLAQSVVAKMYARGIGTKPSHKKALRWYEKAAEQGSSEAQYIVGAMYYKGKGCEKDLGKAFHWYHESANQNHLSAQLNLGYLYGKGHGVERDDEEAYLWIKKAAEGGLAKAQYNLGVIYAKGRGITANLPEAYKWFQTAADQGDKNAQKSLEKLEKTNPEITIHP